MKEIISNCKHNAKYLISIFPVVKKNFPPVFRGMAWPLISHDFRHLAVKISCGLPRESAGFNQSERAFYRNFIKRGHTMHRCAQQCVTKLHVMLQMMNTRWTHAEVRADATPATVVGNNFRGGYTVQLCNVARNVAPCVRTFIIIVIFQLRLRPHWCVFVWKRIHFDAFDLVSTLKRSENSIVFIEIANIWKHSPKWRHLKTHPFQYASLSVWWCLSHRVFWNPVSFEDRTTACLFCG